jgi:glycine/D-amino acid oxidase-like deaminating enzyme
VAGKIELPDQRLVSRVHDQDMSQSIFTDDFKDTPFWWDRTPRPAAEELVEDLPESADVVIVGSGYTGLSAGIQTAQNGRHTVVVDAEAAGWGCSSRNGGQVSTSIKPDFDLLSRKFGSETALAILSEGKNALAWIETFIGENGIDCDFSKAGRFHAAHSSKSFKEIRSRIKRIPPELETGAYIVDAHDQRDEIGSDFYFGGAVFPHHASLDPARYHQGLMNCARSNGVEVVSNCKVGRIRKQTDGFRLGTSKGAITARDVVIATSGYTGSLTSWQQRRIIPIGSYMIATEPLPEETIARLIPNNRVISDSRKLVVYYRTCPERRRILFGGRVSLRETDPRISGPRLHQQMVRRFPELESVKISHSWMGFVGYTFDQMPHLGKHDGIYYSMGYCGSGISLASYFGMRVGLKVVGSPRGTTSLDELPFCGRFYYRGNPWFLAPSIYYYRYMDERNSVR